VDRDSKDNRGGDGGSDGMPTAKSDRKPPRVISPSAREARFISAGLRLRRSARRRRKLKNRIALQTAREGRGGVLPRVRTWAGSEFVMRRRFWPGSAADALVILGLQLSRSEPALASGIDAPKGADCPGICRTNCLSWTHTSAILRGPL
jgi:hypothetical protein